MSFAIQTNNLTKTFSVNKKSVNAVNGINLTVNTGEIFGFLGPNGAGKTTTMRMLTTLLKPTTGTALVAGYDLATQPELVRANIGYVSQTGGLEGSATARENLILQARVFGKSAKESSARVDELIKAFDLEEFADRYVQTYSGGQRRRVDIALGLVHNPKLLFLDEPTVGLDPQSRAHVWGEIRKLREQGTTIFLTTHYLDEADNLCDRVAIVDHGIIVALDSPIALKRQIASDIIVLEVAKQTLEQISGQNIEALDVNALFASIPDVREVIKEKESIRLLVRHGEALLPDVLRLCDKSGIALTTIALHHPTLDDVFLQKTGRSFAQEDKQ
jgi:ABC-2 type transport system ATP-binding protein